MHVCVNTWITGCHSDLKVGEILLLEHTPVYTFGLREEISSDTLQLLRSLGADVCKVGYIIRDNL